MSYLDEDWQSLIEDMPLWRQQVIGKFVVNDPKKISLLASILFEKMLIDIDKNIDTKNIKITYNQYGKPYIDEGEYRNIKFNISHTKDKVILCVSDEEVGCDIEKIHDIDFNIAKRFFTKTEYEYLEKIIDINDKTKIFYKMWTMKESIAKYIGKGLSIGLDSVDFSDIDFMEMLKRKENKITTFFNNGDILFFHNFDMDDYMITVCTKSDEKFNIVDIK